MEVEGRLDSISATQLGSAVAAFFENGKYNVVVNLFGAGYVSGAVLRILAAELKESRSKGSDIKLVVKRPSRVAEVFNISGLDTVFKIFPTEVEAIAAYSLTNANSNPDSGSSNTPAA